MKNKNDKKLFIIALSAITVIGLTSCGSSEEQSSTSIVPPISATSQISSETTNDTDENFMDDEYKDNSNLLSQTGTRKYLNYNNMRYAFIEDGREMELDAETLGEKIGSLTLMDGITIDENNLPQITGELSSDYTDFSSTFADGGNLHHISGYDSTHRLAVEKDGKYYIAENVGNHDNSAVNFGDNITNWDLTSKVVSAEIYDHNGETMLRELTKEDAAIILEKISTGRYDDNTDNESLSTAQEDGQSYQVRFIYEDGTYTTSYVVPSMNLFSWGDNYGLVDNMADDIESYFSGLKQDVLTEMG